MREFRSPGSRFLFPEIEMDDKQIRQFCLEQARKLAAGLVDMDASAVTDIAGKFYEFMTNAGVPVPRPVDPGASRVTPRAPASPFGD